MTAGTHREHGNAPAQLSSTPVANSSEQVVPIRVAAPIRGVEGAKLQAETTSDRTTAAFVRRTLCSQNVLLGDGEKGRTTPRPIEEVLPPLTSSNEVDLQLYGIISMILKEFVQTWYSKITPDHVFVNEVIQLIAHCTRALEQRLRKIDSEALLLDEIPELLEHHFSSFRLAKQQAASPHSLVTDSRLVYHTLHPHPALSPVPTDAEPSTTVEQRENESAWRQLLIQGVLAILLPTEDLENGCLRSLVAEIFAEMILGNGISGKACESWLLLEGITSIAKVLQADSTKEQGTESKIASPEQSMTRLERFGLLSSEQDGQAGPLSPFATREDHHATWPAFVSGLFWAAVQFVFFAFTAARAVISNLATSSTLPMRSVISHQSPVDASIQSQSSHVGTTLSRRPLGVKRPIVSMSLWSCIAQLAELSVRMPWLSGSVSMLHWGLLVGPGKVGDTDGILDRFLSNAVHKRILNPASLPAILRTMRATLFPNNALGPPRQPPSDDEAKQIKHRCAISILDLIPPRVAALYFASRDHKAQILFIEDVLGCLDDTYLNKHLIFQIVELIVVRLVPELGVRGVRDMMEERSADLSMRSSPIPASR
ncbi:hypothetical protein EK21DRAFT_111731 [Setomelanomma holmii]|uniref:PXA domain-containing protein n=1 Tax=Setomelanomma holmii TaxID=210430 RepID=A0A9P4H9N9_9PLEO|nr:hypothetical protein EK21DRAFT_111731 [Setomelanomma holmii]